MSHLPLHPPRLYLQFALVAGAAFCLYWVSAVVLDVQHATRHFGADAQLYAPLATGNVNDRAARFHPVTIAMAVTWMKMLGPLTAWISPQHLLKAMFAAVGAIGVWAAMAAFAMVIPRRYAALCGVIYACSLGVWYFSSIPESKIVTATLSALYIAAYLHMREAWTVPRAALLTAILTLASLNEIVSCFLVVIPVVDTLARRGWDWPWLRWIVPHALAAPISFLFLEAVVNGRLVAAGTTDEGSSHLGMLIYYVTKNDHGLASLGAFLSNWLLFNVAAPTADAPVWANQGGYFEPTLAHYLSSPVSIGLVALFAVIVLASVLPRYRCDSPGKPTPIILALAAYALLRAAFFFVFNPPEALLFSPAVTLAHMLLVAVPFAASSFPAKSTVLGTFAAFLLATNWSFISGPKSASAVLPPHQEVPVPKEQLEKSDSRPVASRDRAKRQRQAAANLRRASRKSKTAAHRRALRASQQRLSAATPRPPSTRGSN